MLHLSVRKLFLLSLIISFCNASPTPPLEFKPAVMRYIQQTDLHCLQHGRRDPHENMSYKKELRYLFKNYGNFSVYSLLSRLRSAHQEMVKLESDSNSDIYKKYEQISSALLLVCVQAFCHDARSQILHALAEIDQLIMYWRVAQQHPLHYFFHKSPTKWIMGKSQVKEIAINLSKLERKQRELYTLLGALAEHEHAFGGCGMSYRDCYIWIDKVLTVVAHEHDVLNYSSDGTQFDDIAAELETKIKRVSALKHDLLRSVTSAQQSSHLVKQWIAYTALLATAGYIAHYQVHNPEMIPAAAKRTGVFVREVVKSVVIDPMTDLYQVFFGIDAKGSVHKVELRIDTIEKLAKDVEINVAKLSETKAKTLRQYAEDILRKILEKKTNIPNKDQILIDVASNNLGSLNDLCEKTSIFWDTDNRVDQEIVRVLLVVDDILNVLIPYLDLLDQKILPLTQQIGFLFVDLGDIVGDFIKNNFWTAKLTAFTPLAAACIGSVKTYRWATARDYSPIRIALADVNSLLIESALQLDDHAYGKLLYLVFKLRRKASSLKDSLAHEFLVDVTKLESKQYSPDIKRSIVENMFNKYAFLGRIAA